MQRMVPDHPGLAAVAATLSQLTRLTLPAPMHNLTSFTLQHLTLEACDLGGLPNPSLLPALRTFCVSSLIVKPGDATRMDAAVQTLQQLSVPPQSFECTELCLVGTDTLQASGVGSVLTRCVLPLLQAVRCLSLLRVAVQPQQLQQFAGLAAITELMLIKCSAAQNVLSEACDVFPGLDMISIICKARTLPNSAECLALLKRNSALRLDLTCHTYQSGDRQDCRSFEMDMELEESDDDGEPQMVRNPCVGVVPVRRSGFSDSEDEMLEFEEDEEEEGWPEGHASPDA